MSQRARSKLKHQQRQARARALYGPAGKPSEVVVRRLGSGEVVRVEPQRDPLEARAAAGRRKGLAHRAVKGS